MMRASGLQTEIVDRLKAKIRNETLTTGSNLIVTSSAVIRSFLIQNPKRGPRGNSSSTYIELSLDSGANWYTVARGDKLGIGGRPHSDGCDTLELRTNVNGANVEIITLEEY